MKKEIEISLPSIPNFLKVGEVVLDISDFSDDELQQIGKEWTEKMIKLAHDRRNR